MSFALTSFGILIGTPVSGVLFSTTGSWTAMQAFSAAVVLMATVCMVVARVGKHGYRIAVKA